MGEIITFYSYKGGVGRTMALVNIAVLLAKKKKKVLLVDWDLEASGMHEYFDSSVRNSCQNSGLMGLLKAATGTKKPLWSNYVTKIVSPQNYNLDVIWSGCENNIECFERDILNFDWNKFYSKQHGGEFIEKIRDEWKENYDFIFIDSRTGITDYNGICTIQMPDILFLVFTPNMQSIKGVKHYAIEAQKSRQKLIYDRMPLLVFPLLSRFDGKEEKKRGEHWLKTISVEMTEFYSDWLPKTVPVLDFLENTKLPYVPYYSFGEELAVEKRLTDPDTLGYAYNRISNLFENQFQNVPTILGLNSNDQIHNQIYELIANGGYQKAETLISEELERNYNEKTILLYITVMLNIANEFGKNGNIEKAAEYYNRSEDLWQNSRNTRVVPKILSKTALNLLTEYIHNNEIDKANNYFKRIENILAFSNDDKEVALSFCKASLTMIDYYNKNEEEINRAVLYYNNINKLWMNYKTDLEISSMLGIAAAYLVNYYGDLGVFNKSLKFYNHLINLWQNYKKYRDVSLTMGQTTVNLIAYYGEKGKPDKGEKFYHYVEELRQIYNKEDDFLNFLARAAFNLTTYYGEKGNFDKTMEFFEKVEKAWYSSKKNKTLSLILTQTLVNLTNIYGKNHDIDKTICFYERIQKIFQNHKLDRDISLEFARASVNLINVYSEDHKFEKAGEYFTQIEQLWQNYKEDKDISLEFAKALFNLSTYYGNIGNLVDSEKYYDRLEKLWENYKDDKDISFELASASFNLIMNCKEYNVLNRTEKYFQRFDELAKKFSPYSGIDKLKEILKKVQK